VICLATVVYVFIGLLAASDQVVSSRYVSLEIWQGTLALETLGRNDVLLINGLVSELGDPCCKNWTTAVVSFYLAGRQCLRTHSIHVLKRLINGVTCKVRGCLFLFILIIIIIIIVILQAVLLDNGSKVVKVDAELYQYLAACRSSGLIPANCLDSTVAVQHQPHQQLLLPSNNNGATPSEANDSGSCREPPAGVARAAQYATSSGK